MAATIRNTDHIAAGANAWMLDDSSNREQCQCLTDRSLAERHAFVLCRLKQRLRGISAAAGIRGLAVYAVARLEPQCLHRRLQNSGAIAHAEAQAIASKPWSKDGSESRGQAGVTGPPGSANPLCPCTLHALVAVRTSAGASTVWEGGLAYVEEPSAERDQHVVVPEAHAFPAPVARNSSWPQSHGCGPSSALVYMGSVKI